MQDSPVPHLVATERAGDVTRDRCGEWCSPQHPWDECHGQHQRNGRWDEDDDDEDQEREHAGIVTQACHIGRGVGPGEVAAATFENAT
jgi:hypothetical protein